MKTTNTSIIDWELHLLKVKKTPFQTQINDPFQSPIKRWLIARLRRIRRIFKKSKRD